MFGILMPLEGMLQFLYACLILTEPEVPVAIAAFDERVSQMYWPNSTILVAWILRHPHKARSVLQGLLQEKNFKHLVEVLCGCLAELDTEGGGAPVTISVANVNTDVTFDEGKIGPSRCSIALCALWPIRGSYRSDGISRVL